MPLSRRRSLTPQKLWLGASKQSHVPGTTVYREKEDMYDEIIELKKSLRTKKSDVELMRTKLQRLEEENIRKDQQREQLLDSGRGPDFVRTLAEKRPDAGWVINGLKQRILKLEQQCKEKDSTINKLQTDTKTTNVEEMRSPWTLTTRRFIVSRLSWRVPKLQERRLLWKRSVQELTEENQNLKEDLERVLSNPRPRNPRLQNQPCSTLASSGPEEQESLCGTVKSLKAERRVLQAQQLKKDVEVKQLLQAKTDLEKELESAREGKQEKQEYEQALREEIQTLTNKCQELEETRNEKLSAPMEAIQEASGEFCTTPPSNRHSQQDSELDSGQEDQSSSTPRVSSPSAQAEDSPGQEEAITIIQSGVFWRHLAQSSTAVPAVKEQPPPHLGELLPEASPPSLTASPGENTKANPGEDAEVEPGEPAGTQPHSGSSPLGLQPMKSPALDDVNSGDSDDVVFVPCLPTKKSPSLF
ncbi:IQ domain-containing protein E [Sciurus carolinensis]|uniref:IQ domain-containing protein E n=1 Tax=Sciurus carolinensis TaxID=30640 RepID=A0AA41MUR5_SCICA|nr:IQ domain-containing protein E [Sciurus carolinensis]